MTIKNKLADELHKRIMSRTTLKLELSNFKIGQTLVASNIKKEAEEFLERILMSSKNPKLPSKQAVYFLKQTAKTDLVLYRGIGLIPDRLSIEQKKVLNSLKEGDSLPEFLINTVSHYTKKLPLAKKYSEGKMKIVVEAKVNKEDILCDLEHLPELNILEEDWGYFKKDKEVLVLNVKPIILSIEGTL